MNILAINGPNLNMLGVREPGVYGSRTLDGIMADLAATASGLGVELTHFQSNHEGALIDRVHQAHGRVDGIIINPGGLTHTSVALRDALLSIGVPFVEIHLSNVFSREPFRHVSFFSDKAAGVISGLGAKGYELALLGLLSHLNK